MGLMSGTSMDGMDAALLDLPSHTLVAGLTLPYSPEVRQALERLLSKAAPNIKSCMQLHTLLGQEFARAALALLEKTSCNAQDIRAIGSHGQTVFHDAHAAMPYTLQLGCAHTIAEKTRIAVVADFRTRDMVVGGQGAPLAPLYHQALFSHRQTPLALVNIGGIANITVLSAENQVLGYDTGPGNCLMDNWIYQHQRVAYDKSGQWAASGRVIANLLQSWLADPFFKIPPPKSIGKEYFLARCLGLDNYAPQDVQATWLELTALTVVNALRSHTPLPQQVLLCGGGAHNTGLLARIGQLLPECLVGSTQLFGVNPDFIEAQMFAWLAEKMMTGTPLNLQSITGAKKEAVLGVFYPAGRQCIF